MAIEPKRYFWPAKRRWLDTIEGPTPPPAYRPSRLSVSTVASTEEAEAAATATEAAELEPEQEERAPSPPAAIQFVGTIYPPGAHRQTPAQAAAAELLDIKRMIAHFEIPRLQEELQASVNQLLESCRLDDAEHVLLITIKVRTMREEAELMPALLEGELSAQWLAMRYVDSIWAAGAIAQTWPVKQKYRGLWREMEEKKKAAEDAAAAAAEAEEEFDVRNEVDW
ncbi:hypothetical protein K402DRAFT_455197 [Aulographum hederae CBS 113979]|uniref:Uncharacterized protein n=1 Tax=Aulographum hederae CBS 113979 TaxID=1176131 RepID=A0A6G1GWB0_9PEZI|nr:hypothetical protein K402DRAFT_455197 [Aulographum hederae CBS 113979]